MASTPYKKRVFSDETRKKMSVAHTGKKIPWETTLKTLESKRRFHYTEFLVQSKEP